MNKSRLIAITGGIGSGKSVVSSILESFGFMVYNCDLRAKEIMDTDLNIIDSIRANICSEAISDSGCIDRKLLSRKVFSDPEALALLNSLVHSAVARDLRIWKEHKGICFVETAILYVSGLDKVVDSVWLVEAPEDVRIKRVLHRNPGLTEEDICRRIKSQKGEEEPAVPHCDISRIFNDGHTAILPQIESLLKGII